MTSATTLTIVLTQGYQDLCAGLAISVTVLRAADLATTTQVVRQLCGGSLAPHLYVHVPAKAKAGVPEITLRARHACTCCGGAAATDEDVIAITPSGRQDRATKERIGHWLMDGVFAHRYSLTDDIELDTSDARPATLLDRLAVLEDERDTLARERDEQEATIQYLQNQLATMQGVATDGSQNYLDDHPDTGAPIVVTDDEDDDPATTPPLSSDTF